MPDPSQLSDIADALSNYKAAGSPPDLLPKVQQFVQTRYDQLHQQGFWNDPTNAPIGHGLRAQGFATDPTQGGSVNPAAVTPPPITNGPPDTSPLGMMALNQRAAAADPNIGPTLATIPGINKVYGQEQQGLQMAGAAQNAVGDYMAAHPAPAVATGSRYDQDAAKFGKPTSRQNIAPGLSVVKFTGKPAPYFYDAQGQRVGTGDPRVAAYNNAALGNAKDEFVNEANQFIDNIGPNIAAGVNKLDQGALIPVAGRAVQHFLGPNKFSTEAARIAAGSGNVVGGIVGGTANAYQQMTGLAMGKYGHGQTQQNARNYVNQESAGDVNAAGLGSPATTGAETTGPLFKGLHGDPTGMTKQLLDKFEEAPVESIAFVVGGGLGLHEAGLKAMGQFHDGLVTIADRNDAAAANSADPAKAHALRVKANNARAAAAQVQAKITGTAVPTQDVNDHVGSAQQESAEPAGQPVAAAPVKPPAPMERVSTVWEPTPGAGDAVQSGPNGARVIKSPEGFSAYNRQGRVPNPDDKDGMFPTVEAAQHAAGPPTPGEPLTGNQGSDKIEGNAGTALPSGGAEAPAPTSTAPITDSVSYEDALRNAIAASGSTKFTSRDIRVATVMADTLADKYAADTGKPKSAWYASHDIQGPEDAQQAVTEAKSTPLPAAAPVPMESSVTPPEMEGLNQNPVNAKGSTFNWQYDGPALVRLYKGSDFSTIAHETMHVILSKDMLPLADREILEAATGAPSGKWSTAAYADAHEKVAAWWERYLADGEAPKNVPQGLGEKLKDVFDHAKEIMLKLYNAVRGDNGQPNDYSKTELSDDVPQNVRDVFDRLLGGGHAPEAIREAGKVKSEYEGSLNTRLFHDGKADPQVMANVKAYADKKGYNDRESLNIDELRDLGRSLDLSYEDIKSLPPGHIPPPPEGMRQATWQGAFMAAARDLHDHAQTVDLIDAQHAARMAAEEERDNPSPDATDDRRVADAKVAAAQSNADAMQSWANESANAWGVTGNVLNTPTEAQAPGAGLTMRAKAAAADAQVAKTAADEIKAEKAGRATPATGKKGKPVADRTISETDLAEAAARYKAEREPVAFKQDDSLPQMEKSDPLYKVGRYHYEDGSQSGPQPGSTWRKAVEGTVGPISDVEARETYAAVRGDVASAAATRSIRAADVVLGPYMQELGSKGVAKFLRAIPDDVRHRLLAGDPITSFTPSERQAINDEYSKAKSKPTPSKRAQSVAAQIVKEDNAPARKAAASARAKARAAANKTANPVHPFDEVVGRRVTGGQATAKGIRLNLAQDAMGQSVVDKITGDKTGRITDEEGRRLAQAIDAQKRTPAKAAPTDAATRLTRILADARQGRLGYDNPLEEARTQLFKQASAPLDRIGRGAAQATIDKAKARVAAKQTAIGDDLAKISDPHDLDAIAKVMMRHSDLDNAGQFQQYILGNILSNLDTGEKIAVSHPATGALNEMSRALSGGHDETLAGVRAGLRGARERGLPEAKTILKKGVTVSHLTGKNWYRPPGTRIPVESRLAVHRAILRAHSAYYQLVQTYNTERGLHLAAWEDGKAAGLTGQALEDHVTQIQLHPEDHQELVNKAVEFGREETLTQENPIAKAISDAATKARGPGRFAKSVFFPVLNLPLNSMKALLDYQTGLLTNVAQARLYASMKELDYSAPEVQALKNKIRTRGAIGAGVAAAAGLATAAGLIIPPDPKRGRYTAAIRLPKGHMIDAPAGAMGGLIDTGSSIAHDIKTHDFSQLMPQLMEPYESENPLSRTAGTVSDLAGALTNTAEGGRHTALAKAGNRALGGLLTEFQPASGLTTFLGNTEDAARNFLHPGTGGIRQKGKGDFPKGALDYVYGAEPYLRTHELPLEGPMKGNVRVGPPYPQEILHMNTAPTPGQLRAYDAQDRIKRISAANKGVPKARALT